MGKDWLYWPGSSGSGTSNRSSHRRKPSKVEEDIINTTNEEAPPPPGCMCFQIFDLPHFQLALNQQSRRHHPSFLQHEHQPSFLKGLEAPRNSLDLDEPPVKERQSVSSSLSCSTMKFEEQNLNIQVGIQIRTSCDTKSPRVSTSRTRTDDISSECSSSSPAGTKTPTLVARLMGLDLLPENNSPRISLSTCNTNNNNNPPKKIQTHQSSSNGTRFSNFESSENVSGTLSLPETPRISSASRRSDVDYHHRLSLQINKENMGDVLETCSSRKITRRRKSYHRQENYDNSSRSPGYYARQIVKQVKESVSRKVGHDITNTVRKIKDDDEVVLLKPKKPSKVKDHDDFSPSKQTTPSCSPRFRFLEPKSSTTKHVVNSSAGKSQTCHSPRFSPLSPLHENPTSLPPKIVTTPKSSIAEEQVKQSSSIQKGKGEKGSSNQKKVPPQACDAIRSKKEEPFVRSAEKKCKKTPLSKQLVNTSVSTILPLKKDPSPPLTKLPIKQSEESDTLHPSKRSKQQLSSCSSQQYSYKKQQQQQHNFATVQEISGDRCNGAAAAVTSGETAEFQYYIQTILRRTGVDKSSPLSLAKWYTSSHPLDPTIFHHFELFHLPLISSSIFASPNSTLTLRSNRKLIFQLVDELLAEILKPFTDSNKPWLTTRRKSQRSHQMHGKELIDTLCLRIQSFPSANCQVLEDIDALIDKDLQKTEVGVTSAFEEEVESIVFEIERDIMEEMVHDVRV